MSDDGVRAGRFTWNGQGHVYLSFPRGVGQLPSGLSPAERELVALLTQHRSNAEIAEIRGVSTSTVANQVYSIFRKVGVRSRQELLLRIQRQ